MKMVNIVVSREIASKASVVVTVPETIEGSFSSPEKRARDFVLAALAAGQALPWIVETPPVTKLPRDYDLNTECEFDPLTQAETPDDEVAEAAA